MSILLQLVGVFHEMVLYMPPGGSSLAYFIIFILTRITHVPQVCLADFAPYISPSSRWFVSTYIRKASQRYWYFNEANPYLLYIARQILWPFLCFLSWILARHMSFWVIYPFAFEMLSLEVLFVQLTSFSWPNLLPSLFLIWSCFQQLNNYLCFTFEIWLSLRRILA